MKTDLYYYTGTGNSLWAARTLAGRLSAHRGRFASPGFLRTEPKAGPIASASSSPSISGGCPAG